MTIQEKIRRLRFEKYHNLSSWGKEYIADLEYFLDGVDELTDEEIHGLLSEYQIEKVEELWEEAS